MGGRSTRAHIRWIYVVLGSLNAQLTDNQHKRTSLTPIIKRTNDMKKFRPYYLAIAALFSLNMAAQTSFPGAETILYGTPEGTLHENEVRYATSFYDPGEGVAYLDSVGYYTATYVTADDGSVYIRNPFTFFPSSTWLKLDKGEGNTLTAHLPQAMYEDEDGTVFYAQRMVFSDLDGTPRYFLADDNHTDIRFTLRGDTLTMDDEGMNESGLPNAILALATQTGGWSCYGEGKWQAVPLTSKPTEMAYDLPRDVYLFTYQDLYHSGQDEAMVTARDGGKLFMRLPYTSYNEEEYCMMGEDKDGVLTIKPQYIGVDSWSGLHLFASPAKYLPESQEMEPYELIPELKLKYNKHTRSYENTDPNQTLLINVGNEKVYYADAYHCPNLLPYLPESALTNPVITQVAAYDAQQGCGSVEFEFWPFDTGGGRTLTKDNLYYRIFVNNTAAPYTFQPQTYTGLKEEMTDIPYYFTDRSDILYDGGGMTAGNIKGYVHHFNLRQDFDSIGVQTVYKGEASAVSDIVWTTGSVTSSVTAPVRHATAAPRYYTLNGMRAKRPTSKGVLIRQNADGTTVKEWVK